MDDNGIKSAFTRRDFLSTSVKAGAAAFTTALLPHLNASATSRYNVLFIIVDDLRPMLGCYGHPEMYTPNIDALARRGTLFNRAYCQFPLCNPSRASMLTGLRPGTTFVRNNLADVRANLPEAVTLPQHFKAAGYHTQSVGRITHLPSFQDDENSWSVASWRPPWIPFILEETPSWQALDVGDDELRDGKTAKRAVEVLSHLKERPFLLAVGFYKPHLPLKMPKKYFELYETQTFKLPNSALLPKDAPAIASTNWQQILSYQDLPSGNTPLSHEKTLELIKAYAASISYVDAQIGRVLVQLDTLGLAENTVIVFCGDHGHHLGEQGIWEKRTLFEASLRSPLIVSVPGQSHLNAKTDALVELVDIYPTLCDACGLLTPPELEGLSVMPVIENPTRSWKTAAFSEVRRGGMRASSMRTERYRYTEWGQKGRRGKELYDYEIGPDETVNIASLPETAGLVAQLSEQLRAGWQSALPLAPSIISPQLLRWDINKDGVVDILDILLISNNFGKTRQEFPRGDVNEDGTIDVIDLIIVASHFGETSHGTAAPLAPPQLPGHQVDSLTSWLSKAYTADDGTAVFRKGIATLERLLNMAMATETVLLPNYPNPFNPETWIPYDLAQAAEVLIDIYTPDGAPIRQLSLGFQSAGIYRTRARAAYWDGRNAVGESVASGIYLYTLQALYSDGLRHQSTRRMVVLK